MSAISGAFNTPFGVSGELGVGLTSILGGNATGTSNAATVAAATGSSSSSPFTLLAAAAANNSTQSQTLAALGEGELSTSQHNVIQALGDATNFTASIPWSDGQEPTTLQQMRQYGWIKLVEPTFDPSTSQVTSATYELTPVGQAINVRTGGGQVSSGSSVDVTA